MSEKARRFIIFGTKEPRKGVFSIWDVAPYIADNLEYELKEYLIPEGVEKIECRFRGLTPFFVAIIHSKKGRMFAISGNAEYLSERDYEEMGFDYEKYKHISDSIACVYATYIHATSDITMDKFEERFRISKRDYEYLKKKYNDYTADFTFQFRRT